MNRMPALVTATLLGAILGALAFAGPARAAHDDVEIHAFVNDACIIADEPFFVPAPQADSSSPGNAKFLPLIGAVVGQLAQLFLNHEAQLAASRLKSQAARKDTRYAMVKQMDLYRADLLPAPNVRINARLGCMTIVAAALEPEPPDCSARYVPKTLAPETMRLAQSQWKTIRTDDSIENQLRRANVCVQGSARAVYEARFEFSEDGTAYRLKDAGYRIASLLTTQDKAATRTALYTLKISTPGATDQQDVLSVAWVNLGTVRAGARSSGADSSKVPWLRVPPLAPEARRVYEEKTKVQQEVIGEIDALKRAMTRNQRMMGGLDTRIAAASGAVADGLRQERTRLAVQYQTQSAELDARNAEYQDLPHESLALMPVTIEVAVTESESEKKAQLALAELIGSHSDIVASAVGTAATTIASRQLNLQDVITEPEHTGTDSELDRARAHYFDALTEVRTAPGGASEDQRQHLAAAKDAYNAARRSAGLDSVQ
jgi:hypothetical protein